MTGSRLLSPRWLAAGGAVVLAGVIGVALLLSNSGSACAAPPSTTAKKGKATFYDLAGGQGNCSFPGSPADDLFVALGPEQYAGGAACGTYLDVTGPKGKVRVKVTDSCPECPAGHLDLSRTAFKKIGAEVAGIIPITYKTVTNPSTPGPITVRVKEGSSRFWLAVLIDNHADQLAKVTVNGKSTHREDFNYWIIDAGAGSGPFKIKLTYVSGQTTTVGGIKLSPGTTQKTSGAAVSAPAKKKAKPKPKPSPTVSSAAPPVLESTEAAAAPASAEPPAEAVDLAAGAAAGCG